MKKLEIETGSNDDSPKVSSDFVQDKENPFDLSYTAKRSSQRQLILEPKVNTFDQNFGQAVDRIKSNRSMEPKKFLPKGKRSEIS